MIEPLDDPFRVLIVDDEPAARRGVAQLLEQDDDFEVVGECATGKEMIDSCERVNAELVFLDVHMPGLDGFGALARLRADFAPLVIFVTGYDRYAVRAFEAHAIDYVLKPYSRERFRSACWHAKQQLRQRRLWEDGSYRRRLLGLLEDLTTRIDDGRPATKRNDVRFLARKAQGRVVVVPGDAVLWAEARRDYVRLHTSGGQHLIRETMSNVEQQLDADRFVRVHRSALVRIDAIAEIRTNPNGKLEVIMSDGSRHAVSSSGKQALQDKLGYRT